MGATHESVAVDGHRIHYLRAGEDGPPVVLLHGGIIDAAHLSWGAAIGPLAADHRVYAVDLLGYGDSDRPDVQYSTALHVEVIGGFVDAVGLERAHLAGVSLGGGVGLGLALEAPERVRKLVLVDSYGLGRELPNGLLSYAAAQLPVLNKLSLALLRRSRRLTRASLGNVVYDPEAIPDEVVDDLYELLQRPGVGTAFRSWRKYEVTRAGYRTVYRDRLADLEAPTLLLHGREDEVFPVEWAERARERIPDAELRVFEACAHWPPRERPDAANEAIAEFL